MNRVSAPGGWSSTPYDMCCDDGPAGAAGAAGLQAAAAGTVSLTTPPNEVDTYAEMAGLLPFTDDQLAEALAQLVLEGTSV